MAGSGASSGFSATEFRDNIHFAMTMGMPGVVSEQVTFKWDRVQEFNPEDHAHRPYDFTQPTTTDEPGNPDEPDGSLVVTCAIEFTPRNSSGVENQVGAFNAPRVVITLLDEEYDLVHDADWVLIDGNRYNLEYVAPPIGLFDVTVYQMHATAADES